MILVSLGHNEWGYHPGTFDQFSLTSTGHSHPADFLSAFLCRKRQLLAAYQLSFNGWHITGNHHRIYIMSDSTMQNHFALFLLCEGSPPLAWSYSSQRASNAECVSIINYSMILEKNLHYCPFVRGIHQTLVNSPHKGTAMQSFDIFFKLEQVVDKQLSCWWSHAMVSIWCQLGLLWLTHWPLDELDVILKLQSSILFDWLVPSDLLIIMHPGECHGTPQMISQHWFR